MQREMAGYHMDFYSALLTPKQREILSLYIGEDFTLSEIAEGASITRQGVHDALRRALEKLAWYESHLGLVASYLRLRAKATTLREEMKKETLRPESAQALEALLREWDS